MIRYRSIIVPADGSPAAAEALRYANALRTGDDAIARGARLAAVPVPPGRPPDAVLTLAPAHDLIVTAAGPAAEEIVRRSPVPVITVKPLARPGGLPAEGAPVREIVIATDLTEFSCASIRTAMRFALAYGARVTVLYVGTPGPAGGPPFTVSEWVDRFYEGDVGWKRDELGRFVHDRLGAPRPVEVREVARPGDPAEEIVRECRERGADLCVVATHGRSGFKRLLLGSVAERVLKLAPCPVMTVRPELEALCGAGQAGEHAAGA